MTAEIMPEKVPGTLGRSHLALSGMVWPRILPRRTTSPDTHHHQSQTLPWLFQSMDSIPLEEKQNKKRINEASII